MEYRPFATGSSGYTADALQAWGGVLTAGTPKQALAFHDVLFDRQPASGSPTPSELVTWAEDKGIHDKAVHAAMAQPGDALAAAADQAAREAGATRPPLRRARRQAARGGLARPRWPTHCSEGSSSSSSDLVRHAVAHALGPHRIHRPTAQGRAARAPRRLGLAPHRLRARHPPPGRGAERPGGPHRVLRVPRLRPLHRGLPGRRRPDPHARGRPAAHLRDRPRDGRGAAGAVRRADLHPAHLGAHRDPDRGVHRGDRGRAGGRRARVRHRAALDLRHPRRARGPRRRRDARLRAGPRAGVVDRLRPRRSRGRRTPAAVRVALRGRPGRRAAQHPARR